MIGNYTGLAVVAHNCISTFLCVFEGSSHSNAAHTMSKHSSLLIPDMHPHIVIISSFSEIVGQC